MNCSEEGNMNDFDIIEFGYNAADETINFGTRCLAAGDNLYEVSTLATLKCSAPKQEADPHIISVVHDGLIYFSTDFTLRIFKDMQCSDVIFNAGFDAIIDSFCVAQDGDYILICLRNGMVYLLSCKDDYTSVFSGSCKRDENCDKFFINSFCNNENFLLVTKQGHIYRMIMNKDYSLECVHEFNFRTEIASFQYPFMLVNGSKLAIFNFQDNSVICTRSGNYVKIFPLNYMFLALDTEGNLFMICSITLLIFPLNNAMLYKDIHMLTDGVQRQIIAVNEEDQQNFLQLLSYPDLTKHYSIKVLNQIYLISLDSLNDEILYISKVTSDSSVSELRFHVVNETEPEQRLKRLLRKQKYEEAEIFAKLHNLEPTLITKAKAEEITHKAVCTTENINNLLNLLDIIDDDEFKLQCCVDVESFCSKFEDVRRILNYGCKLQLKNQERRAVAEQLQRDLIHIMHRLETFLTLYSDHDISMQTWLQFMKSDLMEEVQTRLRKYQIEEAKIIYSRLDEQTSKRLMETHVSDILGILNNLSITVYPSFLPIFVPVTLSILPSALPLFVKWTHAKVFHLEKSAKSDFPNNAINFTRHIAELMRLGDSSDIFFQRQCNLHRDSLTELSSMLTTLQMLKTLKDEYRIIVPVAEYLSGPENVVRILLNNAMSPEEYEVFLNEFLCKYIVENGMELNDVLLGEITNLMRYEEGVWVNIVGSILNCISSVTIKLEAVKNILEFATVPWSDSVRKIANEALKHPHHLTAAIREQIADEPKQVVLRKPKYKIKDRNISSLDDLKFFMNRIIYCNEPTMVEDVYTLCSKPEDRHVANIMLIRHFIRKGLLKRAMEVLDDNTPEEVLKCSQAFAIEIETIIDDQIGLPEVTNNYYEAAGSIFRRLNDDTSNEKTLALIRNVYGLQRHFGITTTTYELRDEKVRNGIVEGVLEDARYKFEMGKMTVDKVLSTCHTLAIAMSLDKSEVMMRFCEKCGHYDVIIEVAQHLYKSDASCKSLCLMTVLLLRYVGTYKLQLLDNSGSDSEISLPSIDAEAVVDDAAFCKGLQVAEIVISKALCKAQSDEILKCLEIARWVDTAFYFTKTRSELKKQLFGDVYGSATVLPGFLTFSTIKKVFVSFCDYTGGLSGSDNNPNAVCLTRFNTTSLTEEEFMKELGLLVPILESMDKEGQNFTSYRIVQTLIDAVMQLPHPPAAILEFLYKTLTKKCIPKILSSVLNHRVIDTDLLYNLLLQGSSADSTKFLVNSWKMYKRNPKKLEEISRTGLKLWGFYQITTGEAQMRKALVDVKWWKKMEGKNFNYDSFFKMKPEERFEFLATLNCLDTTLAREYCNDFNLDPKASYKYLLRNVFINWKPDYEIKTEGNRKYLLIKNSEDDLLNKCDEIMNSMDDSEVLTIITGVWRTMNPYHYEVLIALLNIMWRLNPQNDSNIHTKRSLLSFLKNYQRVSKPNQSEIEQWYMDFPETQTIDVLSEFRLPFTLSLFTQQIFDIIRPELNLETYKLWFDAIEILQPYLNTDQICSYVIKDVVSSDILMKDATDEWVLYPKHESLFEEIDECVKNMVNLELVMSVMYHLVIHTPKGADQVNAAQMCYKYAIEYRKQNPNSSAVEKVVTKVEKKYFTYAAIHILHTYKLSEERYVNLLAHPKELILDLYLDKRILKKNELHLYCPQINQATEALATLFGLDIKKIRFDLVHSSLGVDNSSSSLDFDTSIIYSNGDQSDDEVLNRIAYVCYFDDICYWRTQLLQLGLSDEQRTVHCKARALKVYTMITDAEEITKTTEGTYVEFTNFIDKLTIISNLQYLGITLEVEALDSYSKKELLNRLVQRRVGSVLAIKTMALICTAYEMYNVKYWEVIVNSTVSMSLFTELKTYLNFLNKVKYLTKPFYVNAWQKLIDHSFANMFNSEHLEQVLLMNLRTIQSCPVLYSLNLDNAFRRCMDRDKTEFAAVLLQYLDSNKRDEYVKEIRKSNKDLAASLNNLDQNGLWGIPYVKRILQGELR